MTAALEFHSVTKHFSKGRRQVCALNDVNFTITEGEVFGFVGPNGAGKSTTIKIMLDVISDYEGQVRIHGIAARRAEARRGVAYVPESPAIYEQFTPLEVLRMALEMYGVKRADKDAWCHQWLERFSVGAVAQRRIRQLSKGTVQRVALAHALAVSPRLLILDEPLSGLDPVGRKDVIEILAEYKREGGAIFFTSHVLHDVERIADRFGFINQGELLTTRAPNELISERADWFLVRYRAGNNDHGRDGTQIREGEFEREICQGELPEWLARLNATGGRVLGINPAASLESVFFRILAEAGANHPPEPVGTHP